MTNGDARFGPLHSLSAPRKWLLIGLGVLLLISNLAGPNRFVDPHVLSLEIQIVLGLTAIFIALTDRLSIDQRARARNATIAVLLALLVGGVSTEAATRWIFRDVTTSADGGGYFSRRWAGTTVLNEHGFRERSFRIPKAPGTYRIAIIGDSFTYGNGLEQAERYSDRLQQLLPAGYEVLNFGIAGNNTPQHLDTLRAAVLPADPDFVLLQWFVNDVEGSDLSRRPSTSPLLPIAAWHRWLNAHSALYTVANMRWAEAQIMLGRAPSYAEYLQARTGDANGPEAQREAALLREIIETVRRNDTPIGMVLFPDPGQDLGEAYPFAFLHDRVIAACREAAIPCIDLRAALAVVKDRRQLWVSPFDHHPSAMANEIAALEILETLQKYWTK